MNTLKKTGTTLLLLILALASPYMSQPVQAQQSTLQPSFPISVPQPPEVSRLAGMINYPVSHNTGLIQTEIPLYEIRLRNGFTLPVKLVYRSSGFKPHERNVTGVGWSLTAEPQIAHAVNGLPDELPYNGLYGSENGLRVSDKGKQIDALYGRYDIAPDQYFYLLPRKSGSFFLNRPASNPDSKTFVTLPYDPLRIEPSDGLETFTLTDTDGMRYVFTPMEETETITEDLRTSAFSVYKAAQITAPNNETITFSYKGLSDNTPYEYILHSYEQRATLEIKKLRLPTTAWIDYCDGQENVYDMDEFTPNFIQQRVKLVQTDVTLQGTSDPENVTTVYYVDEAAGQGDSPLRQMCDGRRGTTYWTQMIAARHLQKITFPGGSVELAYTETGTLSKVRKYLSGIVVKDMDGRAIKQFQLYYTFFGDHPRLDALVETSKDGLHHRTYAFSYWNVAGASYDTHRVNAWGYYTTVNTDENQTLIPKLAGTFHLYEDNGNMSDSFLFRYGKDDYYRTPSSGIGNLPFMLKSVTYPTGGRTEFHYEQNRFWEESRGKDNGTRETRMEFTRYDTWGNLLQAVKDGMHYQSYLWSYGSLYPVALLEHGPLADAEWKNKVSTTATDSALIASACSTFRSQLRGKALVSSYTYRPLEGLSSMTDPQGRKTSFAYNRFGELCGEFDTEDATIKDYTYHYESDGTGGTLRFSISRPSVCEVNKILTFTATVTAGSGDCQYQWTLRQGSAIIGKQDLSSAGSFSHSFSQTGDYILTCRVTDGSGMTAVKSTAVKVETPAVDPTVSFYYVNQSTQGTLYALEAEFMCPFQTEMTFALTYSAKSFTPATYYITGSDNKEYKFTRTGEGSDLVTVSLPAGKVRIYVTYDQRDERCYLDILSGTGGILLKYPTHLDINTRID